MDTLYMLECDGPWEVMPGDRTQKTKVMHWLYDAFLGDVHYRQTHRGRIRLAVSRGYREGNGE